MKRKKGSSNDDGNGFESWGGYMQAKIHKLIQQYKDNTKNENLERKSNIFNGICIFVNGFTLPSASDLKKIMLEHGGTYHHYFITNKTTHTIASNLANVKIKEVNTRNPTHKIVRPEWIVDSIKAGKLLNCNEYLLYSNCNKTQPKLNIYKKIEQQIPNNDEDTEMKLSPEMFSDDELESPQITDIKSNEIKSNKSAKDPEFLTDFYNNSRLHLISTLAAAFKQHISDLRQNSNFEFPERKKFRKHIESTNGPDVFDSIDVEDKSLIMHIDMDCFFVSVGLRNQPELKDFPVAVTHSKLAEKPTSKSEIASCNYKARSYGVSNGMFLGQAYQLCPQLKVIPYEFAAYKQVAKVLYDTVTEYTLDVEAVSCDELYADIGQLLRDTGGTPMQWATYLRSLIVERTQCTCSVGMGSNRLLARLATRFAKPNGQWHIKLSDVEQYLFTVPVKDLPGVGYATREKLAKLGVKTCGDLRLLSLQRLQTEFGVKLGQTLYESSRGIDKRPLVFLHERKSVSAEVNYGIRFQTQQQADEFLKQLAEEVYTRLVATKMIGKNLTLKLLVRAKNAPIEPSKYMGHGLCDIINKTISFSKAICDKNIIIRETLNLLKKANVPPEELRGIGIHMFKLEKSNTTNVTSIHHFLKQNSEINNKLEDKNNVSNVTHKPCTVTSTSNALDNEKLSNFKDTERKIPINQKTGKSRKKTLIRKNSSNGDLTKYLNNNHSAATYTENNQKKEQTVELNQSIDMSVFVELPSDIQQELIQQLPKLKEKIVNFETRQSNNIHENMSRNDEEKNLQKYFKESLTSDTIVVEQQNKEKQFNETVTEMGNNKQLTVEIKESPDILSESQCSELNTSQSLHILATISPNQMPTVIRDWLKSTDNPEQYDITMFSTYLYDLIQNNNISLVFKLLKVLYTEIQWFCIGSCCWHKVFYKILDKVQENMKIVYNGSTIYFPNEKPYFQCIDCHIKYFYNK